MLGNFQHRRFWWMRPGQFHIPHGNLDAYIRYRGCSKTHPLCTSSCKSQGDRVESWSLWLAELEAPWNDMHVHIHLLARNGCHCRSPNMTCICWIGQKLGSTENSQSCSGTSQCKTRLSGSIEPPHNQTGSWVHRSHCHGHNRSLLCCMMPGKLPEGWGL